MSLYASPRLYQPNGSSRILLVASSSAALAGSSFCCASSEIPKFNRARPKPLSALIACSKYFCVAAFSPVCVLPEYGVRATAIDNPSKTITTANAPRFRIRIATYPPRKSVPLTPSPVTRCSHSTVIIFFKRNWLFKHRLTSFLPRTTLLQLMTLSPYSSVADLTTAFQKKEVSPLEILNLHLQRAENLRSRLNAFVHVDGENARKAAADLEKSGALSTAQKPLHGIPVSIKSCIDVAGWPCPAGSLLRKNYVPAQNAPLVARLKSAGAILIGNTNTPEFLMNYETNNLVSGKTSNPWNLAKSSGGSSGGESASIASGCSVAGVGSDGGGSARVPAHFCGICALKPTPGRVPSTGHFPAGAGAFSWLGAVGPMARTVADLRNLFHVLCGPDS